MSDMSDYFLTAKYALERAIAIQEENNKLKEKVIELTEENDNLKKQIQWCAQSVREYMVTGTKRQKL